MREFRTCPVGFRIRCTIDGWVDGTVLKGEYWGVRGWGMPAKGGSSNLTWLASGCVYHRWTSRHWKETIGAFLQRDWGIDAANPNLPGWPPATFAMGGRHGWMEIFWACLEQGWAPPAKLNAGTQACQVGLLLRFFQRWTAQHHSNF